MRERKLVLDPEDLGAVHARLEITDEDAFDAMQVMIRLSLIQLKVISSMEDAIEAGDPEDALRVSALYRGLLKADMEDRLGDQLGEYAKALDIMDLVEETEVD